MVIGVPVGIAAAHRPWLYTVLRPILDLMQTIPTFVYLIPTLILFGLGMVPGPDLDRDLRHAGADPAHPSRHQLGAAAADRGRARPSAPRRSQLLWKVELPYAMPTIMAGSPSASCCPCRWW